MAWFDDEYIKDLIYSRKRRKKYNKIESLLKDWYGEDEGGQELSSYLPKPVHIKDTLNAVMGDAMGPGEYKLLELKKSWQKLMGKDVAANSSPVSVKNKILIIEVKNSIWLMQLKNFYKSMVEKKVISLCGKDFCNRICFVPTGKN